MGGGWSEVLDTWPTYLRVRKFPGPSFGLLSIKMLNFSYNCALMGLMIVFC